MPIYSIFCIIHIILTENVENNLEFFLINLRKVVVIAEKLLYNMDKQNRKKEKGYYIE